MSGASVALLCMAQLFAATQAERVNPMEKIIQMIGDLQQKAIKEGEGAQKAYAEFAEWCEDQSKELRFEIKTAKDTAEDLKATIEKVTSDMATEDAKIEELSGTISTDEADLKAATAIRTHEAEEFAAEEKELMDTTDALSRAITILEKAMKGSGASFVQTEDAEKILQMLQPLVEAESITTSDLSQLQSLLQTQDSTDETQMGAPDPAAYESKSGGIVDQMSDLLDKSEAQLAELRKKETKAKMTYELMKLGLTEALDFANKELKKCKKRKAEAQEVKAINEGELQTVAKDLGEDVTRLGDIHHECMSKAEDFEVETAGRAEELKALAKAKKILVEMTGGAVAQTSLDQTSFLQISARARSESAAESGAQGLEAARLIRRMARKDKSVVLEQLADRMAAAVRLGDQHGDDPFAKVKGMIEEMIEKLLQEAEAEAKQKGYCDQEMSETKTAMNDKNDEIADLTAKIDSMSAESKKLKEESAILAKELADLAKSQKEMDEMRKKEKVEFDKNKAEMEQGIEGVQLALKVLREYYAKGSFVQQDQAAGSGGAAGIIGMLEVVESDFSKQLEELVSAEESAVSEYEKTTQENKVAKATKEQDLKYKTQEYKALDKAASEANADRAGVNKELDSVLEYYEKLKPMCISKPEPYEERKKRREEEIEGLKNALNILEGEAVLVQTATTHKTIRRLRHTAAL